MSDTDALRATGQYYDGHKVRSGGQAFAKVGRRQRRRYRKWLRERAWELGDPEALARYLAPSRMRQQ